MTLAEYIDTPHLAAPLEGAQARAAADELGRLGSLQVYPRSITASGRTLYFLGQRDAAKYLGILAGASNLPEGFEGQPAAVTLDGRQRLLGLCPPSAVNASALRRALPFLVPQTLGLNKSVGCGDRLGLATPGHVRAVRRSSMRPIFAQQSMRENARTGRSPQQVMDDALWGVFQEGWRGGFGADADHLKSATDIDLCAAAGYTFYTFDPGEFVDKRAGAAATGVLESLSAALPWQELETTPGDLRRRLAGKPIDLGAFAVSIGWEELLKAAVKYGRAVVHTVGLYRHLAEAMGDRPFELEMSVDETEAVTSLAEHVYIAHELTRLGVRWVSLAPRYVGTFEKGVDYIGDLQEFQESFRRHLAVARTFGPYKLSLHSGSDKFSVYPIAAALAGELVHLKTAGTSYLEALRAIAVSEPALFRRILAFALERYSTDRASYHVSAETAKVPAIAGRPDAELPAVADDFHAREVLHVTFGSVLREERLARPFFAALRSGEETYYRFLEEHFDRHLSPFGS